MSDEQKHSNVAFERAPKRARIEDFRFHDLKHTFASYLVMAGVNLRTVEMLLGHKDLRMTMKYSHLSREYLQEAVSTLERSSIGESQNLMRRKVGGQN